MKGAADILAILLALGIAEQPAAQVSVNPPPETGLETGPETAPDAAAGEAAKTAAMAERVTAEEAAAFDQFIAANTRTLKLRDCAERKAAGCTVDAFMLSTDETAGFPIYSCPYDALVSEAVVLADGTQAHVHLVNLVIAASSRSRAKRISNLVRDPEPVAVTAAVLFDAPGFHPICFERSMRDRNMGFSFHRLPAGEGEGVPIEVEQVEPDFTPSRGIFFAFGNGRKRSHLREPLSFFDSSYRALRDTVGCTLTGCPEKLAVSITVRAEGDRLPIFQRGTPTSYRTDTTIMVPRNQVGTLSVRHRDGTKQAITSCLKLQETKVSAAFQCGKAK